VQSEQETAEETGMITTELSITDKLHGLIYRISVDNSCVNVVEELRNLISEVDEENEQLRLKIEAVENDRHEILELERRREELRDEIRKRKLEQSKVR